MARRSKGRRLFAVDLDARMPAPYLFDLICLVMLAVSWWGIAALRAFDAGVPVVTASPFTVAMIGAAGVCGLRAAMWIAIARRNHTPQTAEWIVATVPLALTVLAFVLTAPLTKAYAVAHGYHRCEDSRYYHNSDYVFAAAGTLCPPSRPTDEA